MLVWGAQVKKRNINYLLYDKLQVLLYNLFFRQQASRGKSRKFRNRGPKDWPAIRILFMYGLKNSDNIFVQK